MKTEEEVEKIKQERPDVYWLSMAMWHLQEANFHRRAAVAAEKELKKLQK